MRGKLYSSDYNRRKYTKVRLFLNTTKQIIGILISTFIVFGVLFLQLMKLIYPYIVKFFNYLKVKLPFVSEYVKKIIEPLIKKFFKKKISVKKVQKKSKKKDDILSDFSHLDQKQIVDFFAWVIKLFVPKFLIKEKDKPSIWQNIKTLLSHKDFLPLRRAVAAWLIFSVVVSSTGIYTILNTQEVEAAAWYNTNWEYRNLITIDNTKVSGSSNLTNFPVLINTINSDWRDTTNGGYVEQADGGDFVFTSSNGTTKLDHEIESYSSSTGQLVAWVEVPSLDYDDDTEIYVYYDNDAGGLDESNASGVWDANYELVHHLQETDLDGGADEIIDSTSNNNHGTASGNPTSVSGKIGKGVLFVEGSGNDYIDFDNINDLNLSSELTFETWVKFTNPNNDDDLWTKGGHSTNEPVLIWRDANVGSGDQSGNSDCLSAFIDDGPDTRWISSDTDSLNDTDWHHIAVTFTSNTANGLKIYIDGSLQQSGSTVDVGGLEPGDTNPLVIGAANGGGGQPLAGIMDEMRVSTSERSSDWILTQYNNQNSPSTFYTVGPLDDQNVGPNAPTNSSPTDLSTNNSLIPTLSSSAFSDPDSGDTHLASQWQITTSSGNYSSPIYDSGTDNSNLTSIAIPVNTLEASTTYYWHVRYQDNNTNWSSYSTETSFTTSLFPNRPTNVSPLDNAQNQNKVLTLTSSAFSDDDSRSSHQSSWWLIRNTSDTNYSSPVYSSGVDGSNLTSINISQGTLSENTVYYWKVAHQDEHGVWSATSTETIFFTGVYPILVVSVGATEYQSGETAVLTVQVTDSVGDPINNATVILDMFDPNGNVMVDDTSMSYISSSDGLYKYTTTTSDTAGVYTYTTKATASGDSSYSSHAFHVSPALNTINTNLDTTLSSRSSQTTLDNLDTDVDAILVDTSTTLPGQLDNASSSLAVEINENESKIDVIDSNIDSLVSNMDILVGGMIVTQGTVTDGDQSPTTISFDTSLSNSTDDFYNNAVLTFTSGTLDGQFRRISDYTGSTKVISVDPALLATPSSGDTFTIITQNVRAEEQIIAHEAAQSTFRTNTSNQLDDIETKVREIATTTENIYSLLQTVDTNIDTIDSIIDQLRDTQLKQYTATLSDFTETNASSTYRAKVSIFDSEHQPATPSSTPQILIYDALRATAQAATDMTLISTGVYEFTYDVPTNATAGTWESVVTVNFAGTNSYLNDYWEVESSPAQVTIPSMEDVSITDVTANVTITNEGSAGYEYQYEYCVVSNENNQCGGGDDVAYASGAKYLNVGEDWNTQLTLTVDTVGDYYFKVVVYYGTETSGASRLFSATGEGQEEEEVTPLPGGGTGTSSQEPTLEVIYSELIKLKQQLGTNQIVGADQTFYQKVDLIDEVYETLNYTTSLLVGAGALTNRIDVTSPSFQGLLEINKEQKDDIKTITNKLLDIQAVSDVTRKIVEQKAPEPVVETWMTFGSVDINFLITNPSNSQQTLPFKAYLPAEVKPENILELDGLNIDFDANANTYFVYGEITLHPKESVTRTVKIADIWEFKQEEFDSLKNQAKELTDALDRTNYHTQGVLLKNEIDSTLNIIKISQEESYSSPQEHIVTYRENLEKMNAVKSNMDQLKALVVEAGAKQDVVGRIGGIETVSTWGIIIAILTGFGLMTLVLFSMWRYQMALAGPQMKVRKRAVKKTCSKKAKKKK